MTKKHYTISAPTDEFCRDVLTKLNESGIPFLVGGAHAQAQYTDIHRDTKDIDIFCKTSDAPKFLQEFEKHGFTPESRDARWILKAFKDDYVVDFIFSTMNGMCPVSDEWFDRSKTFELFGVKVPCLSAEDIVWQKVYILDKYRFDGADIYHIFLSQGTKLDWHFLMKVMDQHWELFLGHLIHFQFIFPSEREKIPDWVMDELLERLATQRQLPTPMEPVCRGPLVSQAQYDADVRDGKYKTITYENL